MLCDSEEKQIPRLYAAFPAPDKLAGTEGLTEAPFQMAIRRMGRTWDQMPNYNHSRGTYPYTRIHRDTLSSRMDHQTVDRDDDKVKFWPGLLPRCGRASNRSRAPGRSRLPRVACVVAIPRAVADCSALRLRAPGEPSGGAVGCRHPNQFLSRIHLAGDRARHDDLERTTGDDLELV